MDYSCIEYLYICNFFLYIITYHSFLYLCNRLIGLISLLSLQADFVRSRTSASKQDIYTASVDLVKEIIACAFLQHNIVNFWYSATIALSTMDYWLKAIDDGVVDSPSNHVVIQVAVNLPSSLRGKGRSEFPKSKCW